MYSPATRPIPESILRRRIRLLTELLLGFQDEGSSWVGMNPDQLLAAIDDYKVEVRGFLAGNRGSTTGAVGIDLVSEIQVLLDDLPV